MDYTIKDLQKWDEKIKELVDYYGLNCYPQEFEICDHHEMLGYMAYSGMPSRYRHWSFGKSFERQKTMYDYGVSGLPYEMVINSNPCLAYLMRDNTLLLQILTIAHVYGHNDFFANNFTFTSATKAEYTLEMFKNHAKRIDSYIEDPSIGFEAVEEWIDHAHALSLQCRKNLAIKKLSQEQLEQRLIDNSEVVEDKWWEIHKSKTFTPPSLDKVPLEPEEDILHFIAEHNTSLESWQRDILHIVDEETKYFIPQMETKIMNEGWASYWHHKIMYALNLPHDLHLEFLVRHNQVLRPAVGSVNPYHLGFVIWHDIERRANGDKFSKELLKDPFKLALSDEFNKAPGRSKIFLVRESERDTSFLRRFLTEDLIRELYLFQHEQRGQDRVITKVADKENWQTIKETLIKNVGVGNIPVIKIYDSDFGGRRTLYLKHYHDGRDLKLDYAEKTLSHLFALWGREVIVETILSEKKTLLRYTKEGGLKIEKV